MNIRQRIIEEQPGLLTQLLDQEFDAALLGWVKRSDLKPTPAYAVDEFVRIAMAQWNDEHRVIDFVDAANLAVEPAVMFLDSLPANSTAFWGDVMCGMMVWDQLNAAVCGTAILRAHLCCVYDERRVLIELAAALDDSTIEDSGTAFRAFYEKAILGATLGSRTPLMLCTERVWPENNRLGYRGGRELPVMSPAPAPEPVPAPETDESLKQPSVTQPDTK
jgi:hypothetical protein